MVWKYYLILESCEIINTHVINIVNVVYHINYTSQYIIVLGYFLKKSHTIESLWANFVSPCTVWVSDGVVKYNIQVFRFSQAEESQDSKTNIAS